MNINQLNRVNRKIEELEQRAHRGQQWTVIFQDYDDPEKFTLQNGTPYTGTLERDNLIIMGYEKKPLPVKTTVVKRLNNVSMRDL